MIDKNRNPTLVFFVAVRTHKNRNPPLVFFGALRTHKNQDKPLALDARLLRAMDGAAV